MGALGYLTKPVTMEKVRSALERIENLISDRVRRILLIEDDARQSEAIAELVSGKDVQVVAARTGKDGIAKLKEGTFDCIILDLSLPDVSGFQLLSDLNSLEIALPPIVIYTGKDLSRDEEEYLRKFSESIIIKGARSPERLLDEVNLFLHRVESLLPESKRAMLFNLRSQEHNFVNKTVLLVDDDLRNLFALTSALESKNLTVKIAKDGIEALETLEKNADIDLVMMDIMMPRMDGFEAMRRIRKNGNPRIRGIPVIALTAKAMREDHEKCMEAGASDYLPKPVNLDNLMTTLKVWLSPKELFS
jgi:CheY-like chemotaxis protein